MWKAATSNNGQLVEIVTEAQIYYAGGATNHVIVGANHNNNRYLVSLDVSTGRTDWEWGDLLQASGNSSIKDPLSLEEDEYFQTDNRLVFLHSGNTYCLSIQLGTTLWKHSLDLFRFDQVRGIGNLYFNSGHQPNSTDGDDLYIGNINQSALETKLTKPLYDKTGALPNSGQYGWIRRTIPLVSNADTLICVRYMDPALTGFQYRSAMGLYNYSQKKWVYECALLDSPSRYTNVTWAKIYQNKVYHASGRSLQCHNLMTGEAIWTVAFEQDFGSSGFIIADNKLIANCEDTYTYCLDPATGQQRWKEKSSGTCTPISYLNGIAYFSGGGDGKLHAIDTATGRHLWKLKSPV